MRFHDKLRNSPKNVPKYLFSWAIGRTFQGLKKEFESATVNESSVLSFIKDSNGSEILDTVTTTFVNPFMVYEENNFGQLCRIRKARNQKYTT